MPHFIIECSESIVEQRDPGAIMQQVYNAAEKSGLFAEGDIKVRIRPYSYHLYNNGNQKADFIHIFGYILEGRTVDQKSTLSKEIITCMKAIFPDVPIVSMNINDFERKTYCKR